MKTPCLNCKKRTLTCHGTGQCKDYEKFKEDKKKENEARKKQMSHLYYSGRTN